MSASRLHLVPVRSREAKDIVRTWHHAPPAGQILAVGARRRKGHCVLCQLAACLR
ncbi:hypothetical protein ACFWII_05540 [Streptomyces sp. NPDC127063]|uniref:hypothetical protein n=1 Tax=Streptomyces sp. NPDC127063 TaxID=3347123 RepID=UPI00268906F8